jgi:hypothetical protein
MMLSSALPLPPPHSELENLIESADKLLTTFSLAALDAWLLRVDQWETEQRIGQLHCASIL